MATISENLKAAFSLLSSHNIDEAQRQSASLLELAIARDKTFLFAHPEYDLPADEQAKFDSFVARRSKGEPFQYISGKQEFYGRDFLVTPAVLIPRPETEMIVENAIAVLSNIQTPQFVEVGVGSGCISVSILAECPTATGVATDISPDAIEIASQNAFRHDVKDRLRLVRGDIFGDISASGLHLIVSNPPYIPMSDIVTLQQEVKDHEPHLALTDNADGLSIVRAIIERSPHYLASGGVLLMEIGIGQADAVREMFDQAIWQTVEIIPDLQLIPRMVFARLI